MTRMPLALLLAISSIACGAATNYTVVGRSPCFEGDVSNECLLVRFDSVAPVAQLEALAEGVADQLPGPMPLLRELRFEGRLVTEPDTLLPHTMTLNKFMRAEMPDGRELVEEELREWHFQYRGEGD